MNVKRMTLEEAFYADMYNSYVFMDKYVTMNEFESLKEVSELLPHRLFKNPTLILLSFLVIKWSGKNNIDGDAKNVKRVISQPDLNPLIKENNISMYDIVRYTRCLRSLTPRLLVG